MRNVVFVTLLLASAVSQFTWAQAKYSGGDGSTRETAIVISAANEKEGVGAEYAWLKDNLPGAKLEKTGLSDDGAKIYDTMVVALPNGEQRTIYFDITSYFGKW